MEKYLQTNAMYDDHISNTRHSLVSYSVQPHRQQPTRLPRPWDSPGKNIGVSCQVLLQGISPNQGSNPGLLHCRQILYHLSHQGSPWILEWVADPFLQGLFPTQELNQGLLPCRQILATQPVSGRFSNVDKAVWFQSMYMRVPNGSADFLW